MSRSAAQTARLCSISLAGLAAAAVLLLFPLSASSLEARETGAATDTGVVLLLVPDLGLADLQHMPALDRLVRSGSSALMSSRTGREAEIPFSDTRADGLTSGYLTLATGSRAATSSRAALALEAAEKFGSLTAARAWSIYQNREAPAEGVVAPLWQQVVTQAEASAYRPAPGALADALRRHGVQATVIGNADTQQYRYRPAALFVLNSRGTGASGLMGSRFARSDARYPYGVRTNIPAVIEAVRQALPDNGLIVVESGDMYRYVSCLGQTLPEQQRRLRRLCLASVDSLIAGLLDLLPPGHRLVVASPYQTDDHEATAPPHLALLASYKHDEPPGCLVSAATRRPGVVANTDLATGIAGWLGIAERIGSGQRIRSDAEEDPVGILRRISSDAAFQHQGRRAVYGYVYASAAAIVASVILLLAGGAAARIGHALSVLPPSIILSILWLSLLRPPASVLLWGAIGLAAIPALIQWRWRTRWMGLGLAGASVVSILVASATGWLFSAAASYEIQGGARFYGIGNEYGGVLIGAALFLATAPPFMAGRSRRVAAGIIALLVAAASGFPVLGANLGMMLGGLAGAAVVVAGIGAQYKRRFIGPLLAGIVLFVVAVGVLDSMRPVDRQSHFGRSVLVLREEGASEAVQIAQRKAAINWMLVQNSPWALLLAAGLAGSGTIAFAVRRQQAAQLDRTWAAAALWTGVAALTLLNDSGVLAGAACGQWLFARYSERVATSGEERGGA